MTIIERIEYAKEKIDFSCREFEAPSVNYWKGYRDALEDALKDQTNCPRPDWTPCAEGLPTNERKGVWEEYEVTVCESHYPTSSYDPCDEPYSKEIVTTALFDDEQKIWHVCRSKEAINALLNEEDYPLNGDAIIAWRDMPAPYNPDRTGGLDGN